MIYLRLLPLIFTLLFISGILCAQNFDKLEIPISKEGKILSLPYTGGLKAPQFSNIDLNGDGILDLFVFDRNGDQILPFVKIGTKGSLDYRFAPEYIAQFPKLSSWVLLRDFNNDGIQDIFTTDPLVGNSVAVWKGKKDADGRITYKRIVFDYGNFPSVLQYKSGSFYTPLYSLNLDIPAILDIDEDGDMDIISFDSGGGQAVYYQNLSVNENLGVDTFKFIVKDGCWGKFVENQFNEQVTLSSTPFGCATPFSGGGNSGVRHSGSTLTILDLNNDKLYDLLLGDIGSGALKKLINGGTKDNAYMNALDNHFPSENIPANIEFFVAVYHVDVDGDDIRDLIITPNDINSAENNNHVWLYRNDGTNTSPILRLVKKDFLIDEMAYFYSGSHPVFVDVNADGLLDVVIGTAGERQKEGKIINKMALLINTGTNQNPAYNIVDDDYLNFSQYTKETGRYAPAFGDLDGDGDQDLLVGDATGSIYFVENIAGANRPFVFAEAVYGYSDIFVGQNAKPHLLDLDGDGLLDLIVGKKNNEVNFFKNNGTKTKAIFNANVDVFPNKRNLGNIFASSNFDTQNGAPFFIKSENNETLLLMGFQIEQIKTYRNISNNIYGTFDLLFDNTGKINQGRNVVPTLADIDSDGFYEMAVGNERGGLSFYNTIFKVGSTTSTSDILQQDVILFPNPTKQELYIHVDGHNAKIVLTDIQGKHIQHLQNDQVNYLQNVAAGMYFVKVNTGTQSIIKKVIVIE
jgi:hypothetical protein